MRAFVTGGAGFIGSHVVDRLLSRGDEVVVYDNFSTGREDFLFRQAPEPRLTIVRGDVLDTDLLGRSLKGADAVYHLQANADVRGGPLDPRKDLDQNIVGTFNVLEATRDAGVQTFLFASSATVYGEPKVFPTPEDCPLVQTSTYGASKAAGEGLIQAFCEYEGMRSFIFRFVSFVGERYTHGVVFDFLKKLRKDPTEMEVLGDGRQRKSYLYVRDGVDAMFLAMEKAAGLVNVFNLGHSEDMNVLGLADLVCEELGLSSVRYRLTGGVRGWKGDAPWVLLDTRRIQALGWRPTTSIAEGIRRTVRYLVEHPELLTRG